MIDAEFIKPFLQKGKEDERRAVERMYEKYGGYFELTDMDVDRKCHTDFLWTTTTGKLCSIDSKGQRKFNQKDDSYMENHTWVESVNVCGEKGWMYPQNRKLNLYYNTNKFTEKYDYVLFESPYDYILVRRNKLVNLINGKTDGKTPLTYKVYESYSVYTRSNFQRQNGERNKDVMVLTPFDDLRKISTFILPKNEDAKNDMPLMTKKLF